MGRKALHLLVDVSEVNASGALERPTEIDQECTPGGGTGRGLAVADVCPARTIVALALLVLTSFCVSSRGSSMVSMAQNADWQSRLSSGSEGSSSP